MTVYAWGQAIQDIEKARAPNAQHPPPSLGHKLFVDGVQKGTSQKPFVIDYVDTNDLVYREVLPEVDGAVIRMYKWHRANSRLRVELDPDATYTTEIKYQKKENEPLDLRFFDSTGKRQIGRLWWSDKEKRIKFEGDVDESAEMFFNLVVEQYLPEPEDFEPDEDEHVDENGNYSGRYVEVPEGYAVKVDNMSEEERNLFYMQLQEKYGAYGTATMDFKEQRAYMEEQQKKDKYGGEGASNKDPEEWEPLDPEVMAKAKKELEHALKADTGEIVYLDPNTGMIHRSKG